MANSMKSFARNISLFIIARYPFVNALTLLMLLGERAERESFPPIEPRLIYGHLAAFVICGVAMGFNIGRKSASLIHVGHLLYLAFSIYTNEKLEYRRWIVVRMSTRILGVAGMMMLYGFFTSPKPRSAQLRRIGETLVGLYLMCITYTLVESPEDRKAFMMLMPGGEASLYVLATLLAACALCFLPGLFVHDVAQALVLLIPLYTMIIDCNFNYWTKRRGMDYWNQIRLIADNMCVTLGAVMYVACTKKQGHTKED